jgi:hypothetical protein
MRDIADPSLVTTFGSIDARAHPWPVRNDPGNPCRKAPERGVATVRVRSISSWPPAEEVQADPTFRPPASPAVRLTAHPMVEAELSRLASCPGSHRYRALARAEEGRSGGAPADEPDRPVALARRHILISCPGRQARGRKQCFGAAAAPGNSAPPVWLRRICSEAVARTGVAVSFMVAPAWPCDGRVILVIAVGPPPAMVSRRSTGRDSRTVPCGDVFVRGPSAANDVCGWLSSDLSAALTALSE